MKRMVAFGAVVSIMALLAGSGDSGSTSGASGQNSGASQSETVSSASDETAADGNASAGGESGTGEKTDADGEEGADSSQGTDGETPVGGEPGVDEETSAGGEPGVDGESSAGGSASGETWGHQEHLHRTGQSGGQMPDPYRRKEQHQPLGRRQTAFTESMAEAGKSVSDYLGDGERIAYVSVLNNISIACDCDGNPAEPDIHDITFEEPKSRDTDPNILLRFLKNLGRNLKATGLYFLLGVAFSALFQRYVPVDAMTAIFGGNEAFGVLMAAAIGVPLYACGGTIPLLQAWLSDGMSMGSAAVFMVTGPATKITNLGALKIVLGVKNFILYLAFVMFFAFATGLLVNLLV